MKYRNQLLFLFIGIEIGFFISRHAPFNFEDKINPVDFANLFLTLILAIVLALYIEPSTENSRVEKDLLIDQLKDVKSSAKEIHSLFVENFNQNPLIPQNKQKMVSGFRNISNQMDLFLNQAEYSKSKFICNQKDELKNQLFRYKKTLTGNTFNSASFTYSVSSFNRYEAQYLNFSKKINQLIIEINRS